MTNIIPYNQVIGQMGIKIFFQIIQKSSRTQDMNYSPFDPYRYQYTNIANHETIKKT